MKNNIVKKELFIYFIILLFVAQLYRDNEFLLWFHWDAFCYVLLYYICICVLCIFMLYLLFILTGLYEKITVISIMIAFYISVFDYTNLLGLSMMTDKYDDAFIAGIDMATHTIVGSIIYCFPIIFIVIFIISRIIQLFRKKW